jgi:hypothetical protein
MAPVQDGTGIGQGGGNRSEIFFSFMPGSREFLLNLWPLQVLSERDQIEIAAGVLDFWATITSLMSQALTISNDQGRAKDADETTLHPDNHDIVLCVNIWPPVCQHLAGCRPEGRLGRGGHAAGL